MQLQRVLETIEHGFIAFELPGRIFSLNRKAADLLGTDKKTLDEKKIVSLFEKSPNSENLLASLAKWETGDLLSNTGESVFSMTEKITLVTPYNNANKLNAEMLTFDVRLTLFGNDEGTGDDAPAEEFGLHAALCRPPRGPGYGARRRIRTSPPPRPGRRTRRAPGCRAAPGRGPADALRGQAGGCRARAGARGC